MKNLVTSLFVSGTICLVSCGGEKKAEETTVLASTEVKEVKLDVAGGAKPVKNKYISNFWTKWHAHSLAVESRGGKTLHIAGLTPNLLIARDFESQVESVFDNITDALTSNGYKPSDLVSLNIFIVGDHSYSIVEKRLSAMFPNKEYPAGAMVRVAGLAVPQILIEVQGVAVVPE